MKFHLDFETHSHVDLTEVGLVNYVKHPSTTVLLAAWAIDDWPIRQCSFDEGFDALFDDLEHADEIHAWNAPFEWAVLNHVLRWRTPMELMHCTMAHALYRSFPGKLDKTANILFGYGKPRDATRLLKLWSMGIGKPKEGDWQRFCDYNINDVDLERKVGERLSNLKWPTHEREIWLLGEEINWRGVPVNLDNVNAAIDTHRHLTDRALAEIKQLTGLENPNSPVQLAKWLNVDSLDKKEMPELLAAAQGDPVRLRVLELRQRAALSAPKKYLVAQQQENDGRLRNMLQYSGAGRTHRWSGRALQPQNLRRGMKDDEAIDRAWEIMHKGELAKLFDNPFEILADLVRSIIEPEDWLLGVADYSSIEVVMLHWAANDLAMLEDLRAGLDPYKRYAMQHWDIELEQVTKDQRTFAKPVVLGAGYGLGASTLVEYAKGMGVRMSMHEAVDAIYIYRNRNKPVVDFWYGIERAMRKAIDNPDKVIKYHDGRFVFKQTEDACLLRLPSGAQITYWNARIEEDRICYDGVDQYTGHWKRIRTWGGKLAENITQSISRDVLVHGLMNARLNRLPVILHVHDEIVIEDADETKLQTLLAGMTAPDWCADAPIRAAGFLCPRYRKD